MSWRELLGHVDSTQEPGEVVHLFKDYDTKTYRMFVYSGYRVVHPSGGGFQFDDCQKCELTVENLAELGEIIADALKNHTPWPDLD